MISASFIIFSLPIYVRLYIGQTKEEYYEDTNGKYSIDDLIPHFKNGRSMKCKEYKHFIDSLKNSNFNIPYVIEGMYILFIYYYLEIEKQQDSFATKKNKHFSVICSDNLSLTNRIEKTITDSNMLPVDATIIKCSNDGIINVSTKPERSIIDKFITDGSNNSDHLNPDIQNKNIQNNDILSINGISTVSDKSKVKQTDELQKQTSITSFFNSDIAQSTYQKHTANLSSITVQKLCTLSRFVSDGFSSLASSSLSLVTDIDKLYSLLPEQYHFEQNNSIDCIPVTKSVNKSSNQNTISSGIASSSAAFSYDISIIQGIIDNNGIFLKIIKDIIEQSYDANICMKDIIQRWRCYVDIHLPELIKLISYITDDHLFLDVEMCKCPILKSLLKHNDTYNKFIMYNTDNQKWYCVSCLLFSNEPNLLGEIYSASNINNHKNLKFHKDSMKSFKSLLNNLQNNQSLLITNNHSVSTSNKKVWKFFLLKVFNCICLCLSSIHSIYGNTTKIYSPHSGIFLKLLLLTAKNDSLFKQFIEENKNIYQSVRSTQKWIRIISDNLSLTLRNKVGDRIYSITTDGTTCQNIEQMIITIRYCDDTFAIHQYFLSLMEETSSSGIELAKSIKFCLKKKCLNVSDLCSVSFDNCISNTSSTYGIISGLELPSGTVLGYGCRAHLLNLALVDLQNNVVDSTRYISLINDIAVSWSRCSRLRVLIKGNNFNLYTLPQVSQTRFIARYFSILPYIAHPKQTLCKIFLLYFYSYNKKSVCYSNAEAMLKSLGEISFHLFLECWFRILSVVNHASSLLQSESLTVKDSVKIIMELYDNISCLSSSNNIKEIYLNAIQRREYIYGLLSDLVDCFQQNKYDNTSDISIGRILIIMKKFPEYSSEYNKLSVDEWKLNYKEMKRYDNEEENGMLTHNDVIESIDTIDCTTSLHSSYSIKESIRSILNYRDESDKENFSSMCKHNGIDIPKRKKVRQDVLINNDNNPKVAPVIENRERIASEFAKNNRVVSSLNLFTSKQLVDAIISDKIKKEDIRNVDNTNMSAIPDNEFPEIFQINENDINILYSSLISSQNQTECINSSCPKKMKVNQFQSTDQNQTNLILGVAQQKRSRGRPKKTLTGADSSVNSPKRIVENENSGFKRNTDYHDDNTCNRSLMDQNLNTQDDDKGEVSTDEKRKKVISIILSQKYTIFLENEKNNLYRFSSNFNLMILQLRQNIVDRLFKSIIQDLSLSYFVTPSLIIETEVPCQRLFIDTFFKLFSSRFQPNYCFEMSNIMQYLKRMINLSSSVTSLVDLVKMEFHEFSLYYEMTVSLCLTVNPTSIKSETSFSTLKRVKSYLQNGMKGDLLDAYMSSTCNEVLMDSLDSSAIVDEFMKNLHLVPLSNSLIQKVLNMELVKSL
ncbi:hypothetical protein WA158_004889 [Blastocystis sp. Blastoise]